MKRKSFIIILSLILCAMLFGCNLSSGSTTSEPTSHKITIVKNQDCKISLSQDSAAVGEEIEVDVEDIKPGFEVCKVTANDCFIDDYKFIMPDCDVVIKVFLQEIESSNSSTNKKDIYGICVEPSEFAQVSLPLNRYKAGDLIRINYTCKGNYILDKFYINGQAIDGTIFTMPEEDVVITGTYKNAIPETSWILGHTAMHTAISYWYFSYGDKGLNVRVIVEDDLICGSDYDTRPAYQDCVEVILTEASTATTAVIDQSVKVLVSVSGGAEVKVANSVSSFFTNKNLSSKLFTSSVELKTLDNNDGYNGYEVNFFIAYEVLGLTKDTAVGNITAALNLTNRNSYGGESFSAAHAYIPSKEAVWNDWLEWVNSSKHPLINADGSLGVRG